MTSSLLYILKKALALTILLSIVSCKNEEEKGENTASISPIYTSLTSEETGVHFSNDLTEGLNTNVLMYEYFYNGGGVAIGDLNGDGLDDLYFTGNMVSNKLYLNKGDLKFEDITAISGAGGRTSPWKTGVTFADVNGDGKLDIFVSYSGTVSEQNLVNQLFINKGNDANGIPQFEDKASQYGLTTATYTTQAAFFDYDNDGDLDLILLNHNPHALPILDDASTAVLLQKEDPKIGVRLYENSTKGGEPYFVDITTKSGVHSSAITYGLGIAIADVNQDGWQDFYISNDYSAPDFLYINQKNGKFLNQTQQAIGHTSYSSMGSDIADFNNDGLPDIYTLDMLPEDNKRQKLLTGLDNYELFDFNVRMGYGHQYMRNMLQLNQGINKEGVPHFSEIGQLSGISNTDWSWAALFADVDNDGWKDLLVTNGIPRDFTNLDFVKYMGDHLKRINGKVKREEVLELVYKMPSSNLKNYLYRNNKDLTFTNLSDQWGIGDTLTSSGAAYADLDNDGDLDLVINNVSHKASIYKNTVSEKQKTNFLKIGLKGERKNSQGLGAKVLVYANGEVQMVEQMPTRGFQSSVSPTLHFGLGMVSTIDSIVVKWLGGKIQTIVNPAANTLLVLDEKAASEPTFNRMNPQGVLFSSIPVPFTKRSITEIPNDFKRQPLLPFHVSHTHPVLVKGDLDNDGLEDLFIGGGSGVASQVWNNKGSGKWSRLSISALETNTDSPISDAVFTDLNRDGQLDLLVVSGGYHSYLPDDKRFRIVTYIGKGDGQFDESKLGFEKVILHSTCVRIGDLNGDHHPDVFIGGGFVAGRFPEAHSSQIYLNNGKGSFTPLSSKKLNELGMVADASIVDLDTDGMSELVVAGNWEPIRVLAFKEGDLEDRTVTFFPKPQSGIWNKLEVVDLNNDGKLDLILGNLGRNTQIQATDNEPAEMRFKDFDDNGSVDPILSFFIQGKPYPYITRDELLDQMSIMRSRFSNYTSYANAQLNDIFTKEELTDNQLKEVNELETSIYLQAGDKTFQKVKRLPILVQNSPVHTITTFDFDRDGHLDILLNGNQNKARLRIGKMDANYGHLLKGNGKGEFKFVNQEKVGYLTTEDVRSSVLIGNQLFLGVAGNQLKAFELQK